MITITIDRNYGHPWDKRPGFDVLFLECQSHGDLNTLVDVAEAEHWAIWLGGGDRSLPRCVMYKPCDIQQAWSDEPQTPHPGIVRRDHDAAFTERWVHENDYPNLSTHYWTRLLSRTPPSLDRFAPVPLQDAMKMPAAFAEYQVLVIWPTTCPYQAVLNELVLEAARETEVEKRAATRALFAHIRRMDEEGRKDFVDKQMSLADSTSHLFNPSQWLTRQEGTGYYGRLSSLINLSIHEGTGLAINPVSLDWPSTENSEAPSPPSS